MKSRVWQIGVVGTFDVENYGDLLFPLLAELELVERLGRVQLHRFSYHPKTTPDWPYTVTSLTELPQLAGKLDCLVIGGGFLIRFDKDVAPGYGPPTRAIHHPTGYWLTPALVALEHGVPIAWNAPGMHCNEIPVWAEPLMKLVLEQSGYVAVRDEFSRAALARFSCCDRISVVADTGFGINRLVEKEPSAAFLSLRAQASLTKPYIVIQAALGLESFHQFVKRHRTQFRDFQFLVLPVSPVMGDNSAIAQADLPEDVRLDAWPSPLLLAELISRAEAVVGHSYHLAITALAHGVPVFTPQQLSKGKYSALQSFERVYPLPTDCEAAFEWFRARIGRTEPCSATRMAQEQISRHWDRIADVVRNGPITSQSALSRFWQSSPALLEHPAVSHSDRVEELQHQLSEKQEQLNRVLAQADRQQKDLEYLKNQIEQFENSVSWKVTSPLRSFRSKLGRPLARRVIDLGQIVKQPMKRDPYSWAFVENLFAPQDQAALATSFPSDHFKVVSGYGGEKDYEYEARALVMMGADAVCHPTKLSRSWQLLAHDLMSGGYREALSELVGIDLAEAILEVNVFHYGPRALLGPHCDLPDKIVTHVLYFNESWSTEDGGCLSILRSRDTADVVAQVAPIVGNSAVLVRGENSWHAVSPVAGHTRQSRRSLTATFYQPGSVSSLWPVAT